MEFTKIKDEQSLVRDMKTMAVLETNTKLLEKDKRVKESLARHREMQANINSLTDRVHFLEEALSNFLRMNNNG